MATQEHPDLEKLRRFALAIALVLITYSLALEFDPGEGVRPLGLPFKVVRPEFLPIGLMLASIYGAMRFWYYGMMKEESPVRHRRRVMKEVGFDSRYDAIEDMFQPEPQRMDFAEQFQKHFPQVIGSSITLEWELTQTQEAYFSHAAYKVKRLIVPRRVRCAMFLEQADYAAPIWLNIGALGITAAQMLLS